MPEIRFTQEDLNERKPLSPAWRLFRVVSITEGPGKTDPNSIVYPCVFVVESPEADKGTRVRFWFTEKVIGRIIDYLKCFVPNGELDPSRGYKLEETVDHYVEGYSLYDVKQGYNTIQDFRPAKAAHGA